MPVYKVLDKNGKVKGYRVEVSYTDSFGKHKKVVRQNKDTLTYKEAKQVEASIITEINLQNGANNDITLDELFEFYYSVKRAEVKVTTLDSAKRRYRLRISPLLGSRKVKQITRVDFQNWKNEIIKLKLSNKYINELYTLLNGIINIGVRYGHLNTNELSKVGRFKNMEFNKKKFDIWKKEEFDKFINTLKKECEDLEAKKDDNWIYHWGYYVFYNIIFWCGCRKGEVFALKWEDIDFGKKVVHITKGLLHDVDGESYIISTPKTRSSIRDILMPNQLIEILEEHRERCSKIYGFDDEFFICGGVRPLAKSPTNDVKARCVKLAGVKYIKIHEIRHSHASLLINKGVDMFVIKERLGHSSIKETIDTYSHLYPETENEAVELLNSIG